MQSTVMFVESSAYAKSVTKYSVNIAIYSDNLYIILSNLENIEVPKF
jgi:hypothetical protein